MNVIELLVLLAFVLFPLLQGLLEKLGKRGEQLPPEYDPEAYRTSTDVELGEQIGAGAEGASGGWSSGWGEWTTEELPEELQIEGPVTEREAERFLRTRESLDTREAAQLPEAVRVQAPIVSMESLEVDRKAEHRRLHARMRPADPPAVRRRLTPLETALRTRSGVQQGIVLAEILGPPRALSPLDRSDMD